MRPNFYARFADAYNAGVEEKGAITKLGEQGKLVVYSHAVCRRWGRYWDLCKSRREILLAPLRTPLLHRSTLGRALSSPIPYGLHLEHAFDSTCPYILVSKIVTRSLLKASFTSSSDSKLNDARTYAVFLPSGKNTAPGKANTPFSNALFRIKSKESPSSPGLSAIKSLNQTNMPASGVTHSANPSKWVLRARSNTSRFCL